MLSELFRRFVEKHIVTDCPPELDDERNYGVVADRIAASTGHHPAYIRHRLDQWECFGIDTSPENLPALLQRYRLRESSMRLER